LAGRAITTWAGDPGAVVEFSVRFARPVVVPDDDKGAEVVVAGVVRTVVGAVAQIDLTVTCAGDKVLAQAKASIRLR
jgi:hypothetical protein